MSIALHGEKYEKYPNAFVNEYKDNEHLHKHGYALKQHLYPEAEYFFPTQHFYYEIIGFFFCELNIHTNFPF